MPKSGIAPLPARVREIFAADGWLHDAVARGIVNHRALARWMISTYGLKASEEAVLSAIRRIRSAPGFDPFRPARALLASCHINVRSRVCQAIVPRTDELRNRLPRVIELIDHGKGEILYMTWGDAGVKVVLDESNLQGLQDLFGSRLRKVTRHLASVTVAQPEHGMEVPGIMALISTTLAMQGINMIDAVYGYPDFAIFVKEADAVRAHQALETLILRSAGRA